MKKNVVWNAGVTIRYKGVKTTPETETHQAEQRFGMGCVTITSLTLAAHCFKKPILQFNHETESTDNKKIWTRHFSC